METNEESDILIKYAQHGSYLDWKIELENLLKLEKPLKDYDVNWLALVKANGLRSRRIYNIIKKAKFTVISNDNRDPVWIHLIKNSNNVDETQLAIDNMKEFDNMSLVDHIIRNEDIDSIYAVFNSVTELGIWDLDYIIRQIVDNELIEFIQSVKGTRVEYKTEIIELIISNAAKLGKDDIFDMFEDAVNNIPVKRKNKLFAHTSSVRIAKILLSYEGVDPAYNDNKPIINAIRKGNVELVKLLLTYDTVDPSAQNSAAFDDNMENYNSEVLKTLLKDGRIDPSTNDANILSLAIDNGDLEGVELLLGHSKINPSVAGNYLVEHALGSPNINVTKLFLSDSRLNLSNDASDTLKNLRKNYKNTEQIIKKLNRKLEKLQNEETYPEYNEILTITAKIEVGEGKLHRISEIISVLLNREDVWESLTDRQQERYSKLIGG